MAHLSLTIIVVACVCYSTVEARPGSRSRPEDASDKSDADVHTELRRCSTITNAACWRPILAEIFPAGFPDDITALNTLKELGVKNVCSYAIRIEQCITTTLNTVCSVIARQVNLMMDGRRITAVRNMLQYTCVQHIAEFEELETCVKETEQQGVNFIAEISNASHCSGDGTVVTGPGICECVNMLNRDLENYQRCQFDVLKSYCRETGTNVLDGLMSGLRRDFGCRVIDCRNDGTMKSLRRAFN